MTAGRRGSPTVAIEEKNPAHFSNDKEALLEQIKMCANAPRKKNVGPTKGEKIHPIKGGGGKVPRSCEGAASSRTRGSSHTGKRTYFNKKERSVNPSPSKAKPNKLGKTKVQTKSLKEPLAGKRDVFRRTPYGLEGKHAR